VVISTTINSPKPNQNKEKNGQHDKIATIFPIWIKSPLVTASNTMPRSEKEDADAHFHQQLPKASNGLELEQS
jgi:hypothetical protein